MRLSTVLLFLLQSFFAFSQTSEILKNLNLELKKEIRARKGDRGIITEKNLKW